MEKEGTLPPPPPSSSSSSPSSPQPPPSSLPRWNKGRGWDGIGAWCDPATDEELCQEFFALSATPGMTIKPLLEHVAPRVADKRALTYIDVQGREIDNYSFGEVLVYVRRIASYLQRKTGLRHGDRAVLLYPPGQEFILAFLGCIFAGVIPVPVYPPHPYRLETDVPRLRLIVENSGCKVALTDSEYSLVIRALYVKDLLSKVGLMKSANWPSLRNVCTDKVRREYTQVSLLEEFEAKREDVAFLQYTSGSTSLPKGVMVTHGNLVAQLHMIHTLCCESFKERTIELPVMSWLPQYHDMGLIGMFLTCLSGGVHMIYLTPLGFLQDPTQWLIAIDKYRVATSCAPNFAFALVQRKMSAALRDSLDLSCVRMLICGAEPIRLEVMKSFFSYFAKCGLHATCLTPAYGLAEYTLCATSQPAGLPLNLLHVDSTTLRTSGEMFLVPEGAPGASVYVGLGSVVGDTVLRIVNPETRECQGEGHVGEIWLDGPCKAVGYFGDKVKTEAAFGGLIRGEEESGRVYLQTGDQGFLYDGNVYITGRIKDLIIVRGRNLYPHDVEYTVEQILTDVLKPGCSGAFSLELEGQGEEGVVFVAELRVANTKRSATDIEKYREVVERVRRVVGEAFQVAISAVVLVKPRSIPKTTSGKIQRHMCKERYLDGSLSTIFQWEASAPQGDDVHGMHHHHEDAATSEAGDSFVSAHAGEGDPHLEDDHDLFHRDQHHDCVDDQDGSVDDEAFVDRLVQHVMESRGLPREVVTLDEPLSLLGFDSVAYMALARAMSQWLGKEVSPIVPYRYQTIRELSRHLARGAEEEQISGIGGAGERLEADLDSPIAIVGLGCKAPGGTKGNISSPGALWRFFLAGGDAVLDDMPAERKASASSGKLPGAYLDGIDRFDASFFGISPAEASHMDYKQAQVLETAWHALEDAGLDPLALAGRSVGVYMGAVGQEFAFLEVSGNQGGDKEERLASPYTVTGVSNSLISNRLSYLLDLRGPSVTIDTACSSSLVAVHDAVQDLRLGNCSMALAGGVNLVLSTLSSEALQKAGLLSDTCRPFDVTANGYCRSEGCGVVVLRRLSHALAAGNRIYAVIRGSAFNHNGHGGGLIVPNSFAQENVLRAAYCDAKVEPKEVKYVEAMGTGSKLGDLVELAALAAVVGRGRDPSDPSQRCMVASCKANLGHLEAAGGIMSLIRASLVLYHGVVPRALHVNDMNLTPVQRMSLDVPLVNTPLVSDDERFADTPAIVGVSAFGLGGANVHVVLEGPPFVGQMDEPVLKDDTKLEHGAEAEEAPEAHPTYPPLLLPISARSKGALCELARSYKELLAGSDAYDRAKAICLGAWKHRAHLRPFRLVATGRSPGELSASLDVQLDAACSQLKLGQQPLELLFFFPARGSSSTMEMGRGLYEHNTVFRACVDECDRAFTASLGGQSIVKEVFLLAAARAADDAAATPLSLAEAALFAIQYGLAKVWGLVGVKTPNVCGEGVGVLSAAVITGLRTLADVGQEMGHTDEAGVQQMANRPKQVPPPDKLQEVVAKAAEPEQPLKLKFDHATANDAGAVATSDTSGWDLAKRTANPNKETERASPPDSTPLTTSFSKSETESLDSPASAFRLSRSARSSGQASRGRGRTRAVIVMGPSDALTEERAAELPTPCPSVVVPSALPIVEARDDAALCLARALGQAYSVGVSLDLSLNTPVDVSEHPLPLYPFEQSVYAPVADLLERAMKVRTSSSAAVDQGKDYGVSTMFEEAWLPRIEDAGHRKRPSPPPDHTVWVCARARDAALVMCYASLGGRGFCVVVPRDVEPEARMLLDGQPLPRLIGADLTEAENSEELRKALRGGHANVVAVYVSGETPLQGLEDTEALAADSFKESANLLGLLRCLVYNSTRPNQPSSTRLWIVTCRARAVEPGDRVQGLGGALWALTKSALQEFYPTGLWATLVDLEKGMSSSNDAKSFIDLIQSEMATSSRRSVPEQLAHRGGRWLAMRLQESKFEADVRTGVESLPTLKVEQQRDDEGWIVVTGGLGGLGLHAAFGLVRHCARRLVLVGRKGVVAKCYQPMLHALRAQPSVEIRTVACDVADREAVFRLFAEAPGGVRGVVHCAGALSDGQLTTQDAEKLHTAWHGKVSGALNLHLASMRQARPLELFLIYGSSSALLGSPCESTYAAANAAADAIALLRRQEGLVCTSLQWGTWTGLGFASAAFNAELAKAGFVAITDEHGAKVVDTILNQPAAALPPILACFPIDWASFVANCPEYLQTGTLACCEAVKNRLREAGGTTRQTGDMIEYMELDTQESRLAKLESILTESIHDVTGLTLVKNESIQEAGLSSLQGLQLIQTITRRLPISVKPTKVVECATIEDLACYLSKEVDSVADTRPQWLQLSKGQRSLIALDLSESFTYQEQSVSGVIATPALLSALSALLSRHALLRTVVDFEACRQCVLDPMDLPIAKLFVPLSDTGRVRDLACMEERLRWAAEEMATLPPVRLMAGARSAADGGVIVLGMSRLLADRWTLRHLMGELMSLYAERLPGLAVPGGSLLAAQHSFLHRMGKHTPGRTSRGSSFPLSSGQESVDSSCLAIEGLQKLEEDSAKARLMSRELKRIKLSSQLACSMQNFAAEEGVSPSSVLLAAYSLALFEQSDDGTASMAVEVDRPKQLGGRKGELGPISVPFIMWMDRPKAGVKSHAQTVHDYVCASLARLQDPREDGEEDPPASIDVPRFSFHDEYAAAVGSSSWVQPESVVVGMVCTKSTSRLTPPLQLTVESRRDASGPPDYTLVVSTGAGYEMNKPKMEALVNRVVAHVKECVGVSQGLKGSGMTGAGARGMKRAAAVQDRQLPYILVALLQIMGIGVMGWVVSVPLLILWPLVQMSIVHWGLPASLCLVPVISNAIGVFICLEVVVIKSLVGMPAAGSYAVNSWAYVRWWFLTRMVSFLDPFYINNMKNTVVYSWWLRALGAKIGQRVRIEGAKVTDPDLVTIGDDAVLGRMSKLVASVVRDGVLHRGSIEVGEGSVLRAHAMMMPRSRLDDGSLLEPRAVLVEGQSVVGGGVYAGSPASFVRPRGVDAVQPVPRTWTFEAICAFLQGLIPMAIATVSSCIAYEPMTMLLRVEGIFNFFDWRHWHEGRVLFCLFTTTGFAAILAFPILFTFMTVSGFAMRFTDAALVDMAKLGGVEGASGLLIRHLLESDTGLKLIREYLPTGVSLIGEPGSPDLRFVGPGRLAMRAIILKHEVIPEAVVYGVIGKFWIFAVGATIQGIVMTLLCTGMVRLVRLLEGGCGKQTWRIGSVKSAIRGLRVSLLLWAWVHFMQLFTGTEVLACWYRLLGATVGKGVMVGNVDVPEDPDLVVLGDGAALMDGALLETVTEVCNGLMHASYVRVGPGALVGAGAVLESGVEMGAEAVALPLSFLPSGAVKERAVMMGAPAIKAYERPSKEGASGGESSSCVRGWSALLYDLVVGLLQGLLVPLASCMMNLLMVSVSMYPTYTWMVWALTAKPNGHEWSFTAVALGLPMFHWGFIVMLIVVVVFDKWFLTWLIRPGVRFCLMGLTYHRRLTTLVLQGFAKEVALDPLRGSVFAPLYLRLLGATTHYKSIINTLQVNDPDMLRVDAGGMLNEDAVICPYSIDGGSSSGFLMVQLGLVHVAAEGRVGVGAVVMRDCIVGKVGQLADASLLLPCMAVRPGAVRQGATLEDGDDEEEQAGSGGSGVIQVPVYVCVSG